MANQIGEHGLDYTGHSPPKINIFNSTAAIRKIETQILNCFTYNVIVH